jgi:hypothetical protein
VEADGLLEELGLSEGLAEAETELDGLTDELGEADWLALGLTEGETDALILELGLAELDGDCEAEGLRETLKLCIQMSQFSLVVPLTFLNSKISPKTLPVGCGP